MKEVYYIPYTKEQFIRSIKDSIKKYKHPWFSMRISFKDNSFIITPNITLIIRNPFRPRYVRKIFEESSGIKIVGIYKMMFIVKLTLIIFALGLIIEVLTGNILKEIANCSGLFRCFGCVLSNSGFLNNSQTRINKEKNSKKQQEKCKEKQNFGEKPLHLE